MGQNWSKGRLSEEEKSPLAPSKRQRVSSSSTSQGQHIGVFNALLLIVEGCSVLWFKLMLFFDTPFYDGSGGRRNRRVFFVVGITLSLMVELVGRNFDAN